MIKLLSSAAACMVAVVSPAGASTPPTTESKPVCAVAPTVVTADIQAGIEANIESQSRSSGGFFVLPFEAHELRLKLVRVHTEYLANLGPRRHFACVDLVDTRGDVYDVDFFLEGDPGAMTVTETTVHKINGRPFYLWEQQDDKSWKRVPVKLASARDLGVIAGSDSFEFRYRAFLPQIGSEARMWLPLPESDTFQTVALKSLNTPGTRRVLKDREHGNQVLFLELSPSDSGKTVELTFNVKRKEKHIYPGDAGNSFTYLKPEKMVPAGDPFKALAIQATQGRKTDLTRARALYDHVIDRMRYMKYGEGGGEKWGKGDAVYACDARTGNCSDFHSYFIALARSIGIPARFAIGTAIPSERNDGGIDGYHCWAEFYADGNWWPVDISEGNKYAPLSTYYFGHNPANRFEFSHGRDLVVDPLPASGPINFLAYPVLEIGGKPTKAKVEFSFTRKEEGVCRATPSESPPVGINRPPAEVDPM